MVHQMRPEPNQLGLLSEAEASHRLSMITVCQMIAGAAYHRKNGITAVFNPVS